MACTPVELAKSITYVSAEQVTRAQRRWKVCSKTGSELSGGDKQFPASTNAAHGDSLLRSGNRSSALVVLLRLGCSHEARM
jgi:hypothetical protein